jgi:glycosyltransferase involved in cell wall biosynthesis
MGTVSLCMIVKNEEKNLSRCLNSIHDLVDEIIIVDTGSSDRTKDIAMQYTDKIFDFEWQNDFAAARNFAFDQGTMDFLMWLDADDILETSDQTLFAKYKQALTENIDVVMMRYHTSFDAQNKPIFSYYRERLVRREIGLRWEGAVHECITPTGRIVWWDAAVSHRKTSAGDPDRNLNIYNNLLMQGKTLTPREQFYYARELIFHRQDRAAAAWLEYYLNSGQGWIENILQACRDLAGCYARLGQPEAAFSALIRGLRYGPPRAELCCDLGRFFFTRNDWATAAYWYTCALECPSSEQSGGFGQPDCHGFIPLMQLCVCYYNMGDIDRAKTYNAQAGLLKPENTSYLFNKNFFQSIETVSTGTI